MWLRKVPELLLTSLMYHLPSSYQNSQCRRLTTLLLKPTGAAEGALAGTLGWLSLSEYLPTRMISLPDGRVREIGANFNDGRVARGSKKVLKRIEGSVSRLPPAPSSRAAAPSPVVAERARVMSSDGGRGAVASVGAVAGCETVRAGTRTADDSADGRPDGVPGTASVWALPPEYEVDSPRGWARVGTSCEKRVVRVDEGLLLLSGAEAGTEAGLVVEESLRAEANQGFVATADGDGTEGAGWGGAEAAGPWVAWELCSRDRMWVWV